MPQLKSPVSLYNIALSKTRLWFAEVANDMYYNFGNYGNFLCQHAVSQFNQQLKSNVPNHIIDELYNSSEILLDLQLYEDCNIPSLEKQYTFDQRILLSMYIHENMKVLTAHKIVNDDFWKLKLPSFQRLLKLNLSKVCTDEILEVVGKYCKYLEFINITSKSLHPRSKDRHNALKLQLCVSDCGLDFLSNCKELKEIQMTCIIRRGCGGRQITNDGIKRLVLSLPKLQRINYTDTGVLLDTITIDTKKLSLVSVIDYHPNALRIPKIELMCPNLSELHLTYAFSNEDYRSDVISALSSSGLKISVLSLTYFQFDDFLKKYLELKGIYLRVFTFVSSFIHQSINELFKLIGLTCPYLEIMDMHFDRGNISNPYALNTKLDFNEQLFSNLKSLTIKGVYWDSSYILPLLLKNAVLIKKIVLSNHNYSGCLDDTLQGITKTNNFSFLQTVEFKKGVSVSFQFLKTFVLNSPVLKNITIESESSAYSGLIIQLREELLYNNVDIKIDVYDSL